MQPQGHVQVGVLYFLTHHVGFGVIYIFYNYATHRAVTKALIGGGGVHFHIFAFCPTNFF